MARSALWLLAGVASSMLFACTTSDDGAQAGSDYSGPVIGGTDTGSDGGNGSGSDSGGGGDGSGSDSGGGGGTSTGGGGDGMTPGSDGSTTDAGIALTTGCSVPEASDVYSPFIGKTSTRGTVAANPWRGVASTYPDSIEDFRGYSSLPTQVECGSNKNARDYVDVTAGCLSAVSSGGNAVGQVHGTTDGYYRSFALANDPVHHRPVAWTDMAVEYSFFYSQWTGNVSGPGFKIFARYLTEYDLYVGSWRMDGTVQIQKKQCGVYTILKRNGNYGAPAPNMWHTIRFEVVGNEQRLYLDGNLAMSTTDSSIKSGTAGIRIDSAEGALIDNWRVTAP